MSQDRQDNKENQDIFIAAVESARSLYAGLMVTVSSGAILFTAAFKDNFVPNNTPSWPLLLVFGWVLLGVTVILSAILVGRLTSALLLALDKEVITKDDMDDPMTRKFATTQFITFVSGLVLLLLFFIINLF